MKKKEVEEKANKDTTLPLLGFEPKISVSRAESSIHKTTVPCQLKTFYTFLLSFSSNLFFLFSIISFSKRFSLGLSSHKVKLKLRAFCFLPPSTKEAGRLGVALA